MDDGAIVRTRNGRFMCPLYLMLNEISKNRDTRALRDAAVMSSHCHVARKGVRGRPKWAVVARLARGCRIDIPVLGRL